MHPNAIARRSVIDESISPAFFCLFGNVVLVYERGESLFEGIERHEVCEREEVCVEVDAVGDGCRCDAGVYELHDGFDVGVVVNQLYVEACGSFEAYEGAHCEAAGVLFAGYGDGFFHCVVVLVKRYLKGV